MEKTFCIKEGAACLTVGEYLKARLHFSKHQISSLKYRDDGIRVNGETSRVSRVLKSGDVLSVVPKTAGNLYLDHGTFTSPPEILFEDADLLIVNKPSGMVCHPSPGHYADSLANQAAFYASSKGEDWTIRLVGRLDKDTSGVVLFAKNSETAARLSLGNCGVSKTYYALVEGLAGSGTIDIPIASDPEVLGKMKARSDGKPAETCYETVAEKDGCSVLKVRIKNGRTHQIRVHLSYAGYPLVGDPIYGHGMKGQTHAMLHCREVSFLHPFTEEKMVITAPFPKDWPAL